MDHPDPTKDYTISLYQEATNSNLFKEHITSSKSILFLVETPMFLVLKIEQGEFNLQDIVLSVNCINCNVTCSRFECKNGGNPNYDTCSCECASGFQGPKCEDKGF